MTAQAPERISYQGEMVSLCTQPLKPYLEQNGIKINSFIQNSSNWRGYVGAWEIENNQLRLLNIHAHTKGGKLSLSTLFPSHPRFILSRRTKPVLADWYNGTLRIPRGEQLKYIHAGYGSVYEEDILVTIEKGIVTEIEIRKNDESTKYVWDENISGTRHASESDWPRSIPDVEEPPIHWSLLGAGSVGSIAGALGTEDEGVAPQEEIDVEKGTSIHREDH